MSLLCLIVACAHDSLYQDDDVTFVRTLRATFMDQPDTRTVFGESTSSGSFSKIEWKAGDRISVFSSSGSDIFETTGGGETTTFTSVSGEGLSGSFFLGLSPYVETATAEVSSSNSSISATIPVEQVGVGDSFDPNALIAVGSATKIEDKMTFYNVCSGLRFTLSGSNVTKYKSIELTGNDGEKIAGNVVISYSPSSSPVVSSCDATSVTLIPKSGSFAKNTSYYLVFRPGVFKKGFTLTFKDSSNNAVVTSKCSSYVEFKRSVFASINGADIPSHLEAIRDGELLSKNGTANCYIVSKKGSYKFPVSRATEEDYLPGVTRVGVLWETDNTTGQQTVGSIITKLAFNKQHVYFDTPSTLKDGNAVIVAYNSANEIVWSWHIWVCGGYDPVTSSQTYTGKTVAMMDRNLGALTSSPSPLSNGLFYQWGRKDPFPGAAESYVADPEGGHFMVTTKGTISSVSSESVEATVDYAIAHPDKFITTTKASGDWLAASVSTLWAQTKTVYDPCPAGWRIPAAVADDSSQEAWSNVSYSSSDKYGVYLDSSPVRAWYPDNGYISTSGALYMVGQQSLYWSNSTRSLTAYTMEVKYSTSSGKQEFNPSRGSSMRGEGHSVRCIKDK